MLTLAISRTKASSCARRLGKNRRNLFHHAAATSGGLFVLLLFVLEQPNVALAQNAEAGLGATYPLPAISIKQLQNLTDTNGIHEFAHGTVPWQENGYCAEDVARALVAVTDYERVTGKRDARPLARIYLRYLQNSVRDDGQLWNREGRMLASGDSYGRVLWGLGYAAAAQSDAEIAGQAARLLDRIIPGCNEKLGGFPIANAYAIQGLSAFIRKYPGVATQAALAQCVNQNLDCYRRHSSAKWQWFDGTMTYDPGRFPLAMLLAYEATGTAECRETGLASLDFLLKVTFSPDGHQLRPVGNQGWYPEHGEPAQFDEQPIDAASIVEACVAAARITGRKHYADCASKAFEWFLGNNLKGAAIYDASSGGSHDGLTIAGVNVNEGGESTIMYVIARCNLEDLLNDHRPK
jgi:hypothetical protein